MSYTPNSIEVAVYRTLASILPAGVTLIYANQDGPRPTDGTYATLLVTADVPLGLRTVEMTATAGVDAGEFAMRTGQQRRISVSVQTFGPASYSAIAQVMALYEHPLISYDAAQRGVSLTQCGEATRVAEIIGTETEDRWSVTMTGAYHRVDSLDVAALAQVVGDLTVDDDPDPVATLTVTVP